MTTFYGKQPGQADPQAELGQAPGPFQDPEAKVAGLQPGQTAPTVLTIPKSKAQLDEDPPE